MMNEKKMTKIIGELLRDAAERNALHGGGEATVETRLHAGDPIRSACVELTMADGSVFVVTVLKTV